MHGQQNFKNSSINISTKYIHIKYKSLYCEGPNFGIWTTYYNCITESPHMKLVFVS